MHDVREQIVVLEPVVRVDPVVVDRQRAGPDAALVLRGRVRSEFPGEHVENLLADPPALSERCERKVVGVHLSEACGMSGSVSGGKRN